MKKISFILMILIASAGSAAGLNQLIDSFKKPVTPQPTQVPTPPKPPGKK